MQPTRTDPTGAMQNLVYTMLDVFDATRDLHQTLSMKEQRDYELRLRAKGHPSSRGLEFVKDGDLSGEEAIMMDKTALKRQFEAGLRAVGPQFAIGDGKPRVDSWEVCRVDKMLPSTIAYRSPIADHRAAGYSTHDFSVRPSFIRPCFKTAIEARRSIQSSRSCFCRYPCRPTGTAASDAPANVSIGTPLCSSLDP